MNAELIDEWVAKAENNYISALDLAQKRYVSLRVPSWG